MIEQPVKPTPGPWEWSVQDHSMAILHGPGNEHVLSVGPCPACEKRVKDGEWKWGRCMTPTEIDAKLLAAAPATAAERDRLALVNERLISLLDEALAFVAVWAGTYAVNHDMNDVHPKHQETIDKIQAVLDEARQRETQA